MPTAGDRPSRNTAPIASREITRDACSFLQLLCYFAAHPCGAWMLLARCTRSGCWQRRSHAAPVAKLDCCHGHDSTTDAHDTHAPCKGHPNCHGLCTYLPAQKTSFEKCLDHVVIDFAVDAQAAMRLAGVCHLAFAPGTCEFGPPPPLRLHLLSSDPLDLMARDFALCCGRCCAARSMRHVKSFD